MSRTGTGTWAAGQVHQEQDGDGDIRSRVETKDVGSSVGTGERWDEEIRSRTETQALQAG